MSNLRPGKQRRSVQPGLWLTALVSLVGGCSGYVEYHAHSAILSFTQAEAAVPEGAISLEDQLALQSKLTAFASAIEKQEPAKLILTSSNLNTFVNKNPEVAGVANFEIENNQLFMQISMKLDGFPGFWGRYFNAKTSLNVGLVDEFLVVTPDTMTIGDEQVPETFMDEFKTLNFAEDLMQDRDFRALIKQVESIRIEDNKVVIENE